MADRYDNNVKKRAADIYSECKPAAEISRIIGANEATIRKWLRDFGIEIKPGGAYSLKFDANIVSKIMEMYNRGINTPQIDRELHLKRGISSYLLRKNNIELHHRGPKSMIGNENFFDVIDTEQKAYYLGWIMADGNISINNGQYSLKIHLALHDKEIIDNFLIATESRNKTKVKEGEHPSYYVSLTSVHMCKKLMNFGVVPRKSGFEIFPEAIPEQLKHHFVRGIFDGDGIASIASKRSGFVGSKDMLLSILEVMGEENKWLIENKRNKNIFYFLGGKKFSKKLYNYLYNDATIWLSRKRKNLEKICFE